MRQKLTIVIGLPGSGKTTWLNECHKSADGTVFDDFHARARGDSGEFEASRCFDTLRDKLSAGFSCVIADIAYCRTERLERAERAIRSLAEHLGIEIEIERIFFSNDPQSCRHNVVHRYALEPSRCYLNELQTIDELTLEYDAPPNSLPVQTCCSASRY